MGMGRKENRIRFDGFMFSYHLAWTLAVLPCLPLLPLIRKGRLGRRLVPDLPATDPRRNNLWVHALSVGEVISALPLLEALHTRHPERGLVFTAATSRGLAVAAERLPDRVSGPAPMPVDFWWSMRRMIRSVRPALFVLVETDIWPGLLDRLRRKGIRSILVNGRVSPGTFRSYRRFRRISRKMFDPLSLCLTQSALDTERLLAVGVPPEKVVTAGNIKFDREIPPMGESERVEWLGALGFSPDHVIWVAGSTHPGEEEAVLGAFKRLMSAFPALRLVLAPRQVARSREIAATAREMGLRPALRTGDREERGASHDVLVLDTLGELDRVYGLAHVAFVGGSLVPFGGHNLLEPAGFGCPVVFGPHTHNFVSMSRSLEAAGGGIRVADGAALYRTLKALLEDGAARKRMGGRARRFMEENRGAMDRVLNAIDTLLAETPARDHSGTGRTFGGIP